jgi:drug/metabolite transporter (DMT)-like permease
VLAISIAGISFAGPLIRLSDADPLAIAVWRLLFSLLIVGVLLAATGSWRELRLLRRSEGLLGTAAGIMLALHFWSWNTSIGLTTIAASVVLVNLQPAFVALISARWLREAPGRMQWLGIFVALCGAAVVALAGGAINGGSPRMAMLANLLAVAGAITAAMYYTTGRKLRAGLSLWPYVTVVYGACLVTLLVLSAASGVRLTGYPPSEFMIFAALAAGPIMLGHTGMNYALRYLPAYIVNLAVLGEPIGATVLAALLPGIREVPTIGTLAGGALVLAGMILTLWRRR